MASRWPGMGKEKKNHVAYLHVCIFVYPFINAQINCYRACVGTE